MFISISCLLVRTLRDIKVWRDCLDVEEKKEEKET